MNFDCMYNGYEYLRSESSNIISPRIIPPPFIRPTGQNNVFKEANMNEK